MKNSRVQLLMAAAALSMASLSPATLNWGGGTALRPARRRATTLVDRSARHIKDAEIRAWNEAVERKKAEKRAGR
jgi:hypothetical protein